MGDGATARAEGEGKRGRGKEEKRECKRHVSEGRLAVCTRAHTHTQWLAGSQADRCPSASDLLPSGELGSKSTPCCKALLVLWKAQLALTSCGPRGERREAQTPGRKSLLARCCRDLQQELASRSLRTGLCFSESL